MTAPALPGSLADLLAVGMWVARDADWLHEEHDPELMRPVAGIVHTVGNGTVDIVDDAYLHTDRTIVIDRIHDCDDEHCPYRPRMATAAEVRYTARWLLRTVGRGRGRLDRFDRESIHIAVTLLTKGIL